MRYLACFVSLIFVAHSHAQLADEDVGATVENGRVKTWAADHGLGAYTRPERVFHGVMDLISGSVVGDEPGYFFLENSPFAGQSIAFDIRRAVRAWDPGAPSNAPGSNFLSTAASTITFGDAILGTATTPLVDPVAPVTGLQILVPGAGLDFHFPMTLDAPASEGIYLVELQLRTSLAGVSTSDPYWLVLNYGLSETEHERAVTYATEYIVPAPATALALVPLAVRRRRQSCSR